MKPDVKITVAVALVLTVAVIFWPRPQTPISLVENKPEPLNDSTQELIAAEAVTAATTTNALPTVPQTELKRRRSEFSTDEKIAFEKNFETRYKSAIQKWASAFEGRIPFDPAAVTADRLVERIGRNDAYREYVFVIDGITLGVEDKSGVARVDYVNNPQNTRKMMQTGSDETPIVQVPVSRDEIATMLEKEGGRRFAPHDIRMTPSGLSGGLNGGVIVDVGGNPENGASWDYEMVFAPDGKLAFYLRGI